MAPRIPIFADSSYFIALNSKRDEWRYPARRARSQLDPLQPLVTSMGVLGETLAHFSRSPSPIRTKISHEMQALQDIPFYTVVAHDWDLVRNAIDLYAGEFADSTLSLQDCVAIQIMREYGITSILTADQEFARAGFTPLLRRYM